MMSNLKRAGGRAFEAPFLFKKEIVHGKKNIIKERVRNSRRERYIFRNLRSPPEGIQTDRRSMVSLPKMLVDSCIGGDVAILGCGRYFEIWNRKEREEYFEKDWEQYVAMLEAV